MVSPGPGPGPRRPGAPCRGGWGPGSLPDARAHVGRSHHAVALLAAPRVAEFLEIRERPVDAPVRRRVRVGLHLRAQVLVGLEVAPHARPAEEEALLRREAADPRAWL